MRKPQFVIVVLTAGMIVAVASSLLLGAEPHRPGSTGNRPHRSPATQAGAESALSVPAGRARSRTAADAVQTDARWWTVRPKLAAELAAVRRARAARRHRRHRRHHPVTIRLCRRYQHVAAFSRHDAGVVVRNDNYGGRGECLANVNRWANFAVASSAARRGGPEPAAFPNIFYGCSWGICSPGTKLPRRVSRLHRLVTSWYTAGRPRGRWDVAYDIWFARRRHASGQDRGAEIMLWLRTSGLGRPARHGLLIDRHRWQLEHWLTTNPASGDHWPLIIFRMIHPRGDVKHLALMPFFRHVEAMGLLNRSWWLTAVEAGFEVWRGGTGLRTTSFWVHLK